MIGIVVAAHRDFGLEMVRAAEGIIGPLEQVKSLSLNYGQTPDEAKECLLAVIKEVDSGDGTLILTDMFGGTPTNIALSLMQSTGIEIVAGANLPILLKAQVARREMGLKELAHFIKDYGARNIIVAGDYFACQIDGKK